MERKFFSIILRYFLLLILGLGNLFIFYLIFTPLTVYPVFWLIGFSTESTLLQGTYTKACDLAQSSFLQEIACMNTTIFFQDYFASIIPACIAGSAYYLLLILNLSTPMEMKKRIKSLLFLLGLFLLLNITRIFTFAMIFANKNYELFNIAHTASWYFGSTILVILLWFSNVLLFKIKSIPILTDITSIINSMRTKK
ncbi:MAG: pacearchaeosortase [Nanoarchaeota archaeon]